MLRVEGLRVEGLGIGLMVKGLGLECRGKRD